MSGIYVICKEYIPEQLSYKSSGKGVQEMFM